MFKFTLISPNGKAIHEDTKIVSKKQRVVIENVTQLAELIYLKWKKQTKSKLFVEMCDAVNKVKAENEPNFTVECAIDHLSDSYELWLNYKKINLYEFMCENLPELKKLYAFEADNKEFFEVLFSNGGGVYNMLYVIEYAAKTCTKTGFKSDVTSVDSEDLAEEAERAELHIQELCAENIMFGCTGNGDWVFAHKDNECWSV